MFWRKKRTPPDPLFTLETPDKRLAFRVEPLESHPLHFTADGREYRILDISAGGLSFASSDLHEQDRLTLSFMLEEEGTAIVAEVEIVTIDPAGVCHCRFIRIDPTAIESLHQYVLAVQKHHLRSGKRG